MMLPSCIPAKRAEMTFGYLHSHVPADLTTDSYGSVSLYDTQEMQNKLLQLDPYFIGMRRSTIDRVGVIRQAIVYTMFTQSSVDGDKLYATYQRSSGSDTKLEGSWSIGFGGHVECSDIVDYDLPDKSVIIIDSIQSLINSAKRELEEEVAVTTKDGRTLVIDDDLDLELIGFITDYKPEVEGWIGNTHLGILAEVEVPETIQCDFAILEEKYTFLGWKTLNELKANTDKLESWSALTVTNL